MPSLIDIQTAFQHRLFATTGDAADVHVLLRPGGAPLDERFEVYRNNALSNYRQALQDTFPALERVVGEDFFRHLATQYARAVPSTSGTLDDFGEHMHQFVATFPGASELSYLPDLARLEWALHRVFHAADRAPLAPQRLAEVPPERLGELRLAINPAARLVASRYPVLAIWQFAQEATPASASVDLDAGGDALLVLRDADFQPRIHRMSDGGFAVLEQLDAAATLAHALDAALAVEPAFDLGAFLGEHLALGSFVECALGAANS
jgi:hypothetical protein